jgi:hypothetical protein
MVNILQVTPMPISFMYHQVSPFQSRDEPERLGG